MTSAAINNTTPAQVRGYHLSDDAKSAVFERMRAADEKDIHRQITGMSTLRAAGAGLGVVFLIVNAYQATWALMKLAGAAGAGEAGSAWSWSLAGLSPDQIAVGLTAFGLILAAQVVAIRLVLAGGGMKALGVLLLIGLMAFSVITSAIHVAFNVQGGVEQSIKAGDEYQLAKSRLETAMQAQTAATASWSAYQDKASQGTTSDAGWMLRDAATAPYRSAITGANAETQAAQAAFDRVRETGGGSAMASVVGVVAGWFGTDTATFALGFSLFAVILMELTRVYLSLLTGRYLAEAMAEMAAKDRSEGRALAQSQPKREGRNRIRLHVQPLWSRSGGAEGGAGGNSPEPLKAAPARSMAASAHTGDAIKGPKLKNPADRTPDNKRQAAYSKKLAKAKAAIADGTIQPGENITFDVVFGLVGGNRKTAAAIRNDLASAGVAHWKGSRLIAGTE